MASEPSLIPSHWQPDISTDLDSISSMEVSHEYAIEMPVTNNQSHQQTTNQSGEPLTPTATMVGSVENNQETNGETSHQMNGYSTKKLTIPPIGTGMPRSRSNQGLNQITGMHGYEEEQQLMHLLTAASRDSVDRVLSLLESGVPINQVDYDRRTALHVAASEGSLRVVKVLLEEGASVNSRDRFGHTPLDDAVSSGHIEVAELLRYYSGSHGSMAQLEAQLIAAAAEGDFQQAELLLSNSVTPNCGDYDKRTPLHLAVSEGHVDMAKLLLTHKANPHAEDRWGSTPLTELQRRLQRTGDDPMQDVFADYLTKAEHAPWFSKFAVFFGTWELIFIALFGAFCRYGSIAAGGTDGITEAEELEFAKSYPLFQDVHVMIFIGFGFLMVFLRKHGYTSVGITFLVAAFVLQEYQLLRGFWLGAFSGNWHYIELDIESLILGDFAAGSVLIAFGVVLGKVSPSQMLLIGLLQTVFFSLNEEIGLKLQVADPGGSMTIHLFGAYFGIAASLMLTQKSARGNQNNSAVYHSDMMAMIGTVFLFMFWPSFNSAIATGRSQPRATINTLYSISASAVTAFFSSYVLRREKRFNMVDVQNATISGGVAIGSACTMIIYPGSAMAIGCLAGFWSVFGYVYIQPWLERTIGLHDTCGVNNLHGMPGIIGAVAAIIGASQAGSMYSIADLASVFGDKRAEGGRSADTQALYQFIYMVITIAIALASGFATGLIGRLAFFDPPQAENVDGVFVDDQWWEVPHLELPYYFDKRGEISRGLANEANGEAGNMHGVASKARYQRQLESKLEALEHQIHVIKKQQKGIGYPAMHAGSKAPVYPVPSSGHPQSLNASMHQPLNPSMVPSHQMYAPPQYPMSPMNYQTVASPMHPQMHQPMQHHQPMQQQWGYQNDASASRLETMLGQLLTKLDTNEKAKQK